MTTTHTFSDGITRPAHRHRNPDDTEGGWVADSATVPASCYVASTAEIGNDCTLGYDCTLGNGCKLGDCCTLGNYCTLYDCCTLGNYCTLGYGCTLGDDCKLGNYCALGDDCKLGNYCTWEESPPQMQIGRWLGVLHNPGTVAIGCQVHTIDEWEEREGELIEEFGATDYERALARVFLALCRDVDAARKVR